MEGCHVITMSRSRALPVAALLLFSFGAAATAQAPSSGPTITVIATDYLFQDLPTSLPVGTTLTLENQGTEFHELLVARRNDGVTRSWDELLVMPQEEAFQYITVVGGPEPLVAEPGSTASGSIVITKTGDYLAACFIPQGSAPGDRAGASPRASTFGPPHFMLGMRQTFTGTDPGTPLGPVSTMASMAAATASPGP